MLAEIVGSFELNKGDVVYLSSDVTKLADCYKRKTGKRFDPLELLELFKEAIGDEGTLLLPTFCFEFSNKGTYDYVKSKGFTGALGNTALLKGGFKRTMHPMHSFAVAGADAEKLVNMNNRHSFGIDSPFDYCRVKNAKQIMLGTDYQRGLTFVHYVETLCNVPYRFAKTFKGLYTDADGVTTERTCDYAARRLDVGTVEQFNRIGAIMEKENVAKKIISKDVPDYESYILPLGDSFPYIKKDITENMCRNIYDFSVSREDLFKEYRIIW